MTVLVTARLQLRPWTLADRSKFVALHSDPDVSYWLGRPFTTDQVEALFDRIRADFERNGWGIWAVTHDNDVIGAAGLQPVRRALPIAPAIEAAWRLSPTAYGHGYITEAMQAVMKHGAETHSLTQLVAMTAEANVRSQAVMRRLDFVHDAGAGFDHPKLPHDHPLRRHLIYRWASGRQ